MTTTTPAKNKSGKIFAGIVLLLLLAGVGILFLPSNYYLRQALMHLHPKIDQYPIFDNRLVKAKAPIPWQQAEGYNTHTIPEELTAYFNKMGTVSFVVIQEGKLLFEEYWENYSGTSHSNSFSMAKSIVSLAVGCAIYDGFITGVDQKVSDFYPEFSGFNDKALTIRHLLTMSAGMDFDESYTSPFSPTTQLYYGNNLHQVIFNMKEIEEPGVHFNYQSGVTQLLAFIVAKATGEPISQYVSRKLWTPMHAEEDALWSLDTADGIEKAYCCFNSNARDFARLGQLVLNQGAWNGDQLLAANYLSAATTPDTSLINKEFNEPNKAYGYQFWHLEYKGLQIPYLRGIYGQYVFIIPDKNAVIVRLGHRRSDDRTDQHYPEDINVWLDAGLAILK